MDKLFEAVIGGGPTAIMALLLLAVIGLVWDRKRLLTALDNKDKKIEKIIDDYYRGNITLTEALVGLKMVLVEIKAKL